jgi:hypothetical protein
MNASVTNSRTIVICLDGTANAPTHRTNVRRLFESLASQHRPDLLCYYDPGVGASRWLKFLGSATGAGFSLNVREAATFLGTHYRTGDKIYIFGFSRGATEALDLIGFLRVCGLPTALTPWPNLDPEQINILQAEQDLEQIESALQKRQRETQAAVLSLWKRIYKKRPFLHPNAFAGVRTNATPVAERRLKEWWIQERGIDIAAGRPPNPQIEFVGLWDPVDSVADSAYGSFTSAGRLERRTKIGRGYHNYALGPEIANACFALSLDERRGAYFPILPPYSPALEPKNSKFVWFAGDHSDVGGNHGGRKDLAGISMNWMMQNMTNGLFHGETPEYYENALGIAHDLTTHHVFKAFERRVRSEMFNTSNTPTNLWHALPSNPVRSEGWNHMIHTSVWTRINAGKGYFPRPFEDLPDHLKSFPVAP